MISKIWQAPVAIGYASLLAWSANYQNDKREEIPFMYTASINVRDKSGSDYALALQASH